MQRIAFRMRLKADAIAAYEEAHRHVWPELVKKAKAVGIRHHSVFRSGQDLFLYLQVPDFESAWQELANDPVNQRWQQEMSEFFEPVPDPEPGKPFGMMKEVYYME